MSPIDGSSILILGAGPAGLTAADELVRHGYHPVVLEADPALVGGLARTFEHQGFRFDLGGHRFFTKNREVEALWRRWLGPDLLEVPRRSRILYGGRMFHYPLRPLNAFLNLGPLETLRCLASYVKARISPTVPVHSFEDWVVNQFGRRLYEIFFRTYTEKVWGIPCRQISADWAVQRIRGLSLGGAVLHALKLGGRGFRTLTETFSYPRLGPGMMWTRVAAGLDVRMGERVTALEWGSELAVVTDRGRHRADQVIASIPLSELVRCLRPAPPPEVLEAVSGLTHRDFLTIGLQVQRADLFHDQWLYVHDADVLAGRIQNYGNWSSDMAPPGWSGLGVEYFCSRGDRLWQLPDAELIALAREEVARLGLVSRADVRGGMVMRVPNAYPVYSPGYRDRVEVARRFLRTELPRVQLVGRNGMHRYNNQDHAMLTGLVAARNLIRGRSDDPFEVNDEAEYLEDRLVPRALENR